MPHRASAASQLVVPGVLAPALQLVSGVLVVLLGQRLAGRWREMRTSRAGTPHASAAHDHDHTHAAADGVMHDHADGRMHTHVVPDGATGARGLGVMGSPPGCCRARRPWKEWSSRSAWAGSRSGSG